MKMHTLDSKLRSQLDDVCQKARDLAVAYAQSALQKRAVDADEPLSYFGPKDKELRNRLRARGRQVGDVRNSDGTQSIDQLAQELAYEYWHRMLFARFLAENNLLMHPDGVAVSLEECEELAPTADPPAANGFVLAARYASTMLPQIFRTDDVLLEIEFAPEQRLALEKLLASLPKQTFEADDSLGWVYQFWQTKRTKEVNDSGRPIDGRTLPAVTQLFTEHYMVQFLLHNTIGAWWCGKHSIKGPPDGSGVPDGQSPVEMEYLRWSADGSPAAGEFKGWPNSLADFKMLDPCCGSGHFLVAVFNLLVPLRMRDERLTAKQACDVVLRDNIFGLEIDSRCTQIAAFALALAAWKYPDTEGYRHLAPLNIACSGQGVTGKKDEWLALANGNNRLREGMDRLFDLFQQAPHLGSLIDPRREAGDLFVANFSELTSLINKALANEHANQDAESLAIGVAAKGINAATQLLGHTYTLIATNVPYLVRGKQSELLQDALEDRAGAAMQDLATAFLVRSQSLLATGGTIAAVTPQAWLSLSRYKEFRKTILQKRAFLLLAKLGSGAFETITGEVVKVGLYIIDERQPTDSDAFTSLDVSKTPGATQKSAQLRHGPMLVLNQAAQLKNPDGRVIFGETDETELLQQYANAWQGIATSDYPRFGRNFWELPRLLKGWLFQQSTTNATKPYGGRESILYWEDGNGKITEVCQKGATFRGQSAWNKPGIAVAQMTNLVATIYTGEIFDNNVAVITAFDPAHTNAIWHFCQSPEFAVSVRMIDDKLNVTNATLSQVPFDLTYWQSVAEAAGPMPAPKSNDPTQWVFSGKIPDSTEPLQVAVARLLGFRWPEQPMSADDVDDLSDKDGILCLPAVRGEAAAEERLRDVLRTAYGKNWSDSVLHGLLTQAGAKPGATLDDWLRNQFFDQHCKRFINRPFIWHIWDGRKDGFAALLNYHKCDHKTLENLTHSYLRDWIKEQTHDAKAGKPGADLRLAAAQSLQDKLSLILAGEPPYDIFVRWKPLHEQAIGWHPDLNDGVRQNIRPFIKAGVFKKEPKSILKDKDRGKEPRRDKDEYPWFWSGKEFVGERVNDVHLKNSDKQAARTRNEGTK